MATVTQCDRCKAVMKHSDSIFVAVSTVTASNTEGRRLHNIDLCKKCYEQLAVLLGLEGDDKKK